MTSSADHAATVRDLRRDIIAALIAVKGHLDTPYPDDSRWTPWTRFVERALRDVDALADRATELEAEGTEYAEELERRIENLTRERDNATSMVDELEHNAPFHLQQAATFYRRKMEAAEARATELERERERMAVDRDICLQRAERAETALRNHGYPGDCGCRYCAALGETAQEGQA